MSERDPLRGYPESPKTLKRTIHNRIAASYREYEFFDGQRENGYGGLHYDGRWKPIAQNFIADYQLSSRSSVLQLGCEKGFLRHELLSLEPLMRVRGQETSLYARNHAVKDIRLGIRLNPFTTIPFENKEFDLVIALGVVYTLNLAEAMKLLRELERVGKHSFVTLATYETDGDWRLFLDWTLLGTTILKKEEWIEVMKHCGYSGDYKFTSAKSLNICVS